MDRVRKLFFCFEVYTFGPVYAISKKNHLQHKKITEIINGAFSYNQSKIEA